MSKQTNPFRDGSKYSKLFATSQRLGKTSLDKVVATAVKNTRGWNRKAADFAAQVLVGPKRKGSKFNPSNGGKCRWVGTPDKGQFVAV